MKTKTWENIVFVLTTIGFFYFAYYSYTFAQLKIFLNHARVQIIVAYLTSVSFILLGLFCIYLLKITNEKEKELEKEEVEDETNENCNNPQ